jgi:hypothetical protein
MFAPAYVGRKRWGEAPTTALCDESGFLSHQLTRKLQTYSATRYLKA